MTELSDLERKILESRDRYLAACERARIKAEEKEKNRPKIIKAIAGITTAAVTFGTITGILFYNILSQSEPQVQIPTSTVMELSIIPSSEPTEIIQLPTIAYIEPIRTSTSIMIPISTLLVYSNPTPTKTPAPTTSHYTCYPDLPAPQLIYIGYEQITINNVVFTQFNFDVVNNTSYPNDLFVSAPDLPPCGLNTDSSRTWYNMYSNTEKFLSGYCGISSNSELGFGFPFRIKSGESIPTGAYVVLEDRACGITYTSNVVSIPPP